MRCALELDFRAVNAVAMAVGNRQSRSRLFCRFPRVSAGELCPANSYFVWCARLVAVAVLPSAIRTSRRVVPTSSTGSRLSRIYRYRAVETPSPPDSTTAASELNEGTSLFQ